MSPYFERKDIHKKDCIEELTFDSPEIVKTIGKESFWNNCIPFSIEETLKRWPNNIVWQRL